MQSRHTPCRYQRMARQEQDGHINTDTEDSITRPQWRGLHIGKIF